MRITSFSSNHAQMASTRTYEDFHKWIGDQPARLGIVANLYKQYSTSALTEALMNVYTKDKNKGDKFQSQDSFLIEWDIEVNFVKRIPILAVDGDGKNGSEIIFQFPERYYEVYDAFVDEETRQQYFVTMAPIRRSDSCVEYVCRLITDSVNDESLAAAGHETRFITNHMPELHETGFTKYQSNVEKHRAYIGTTRTDIDYSAKYIAMEDQFIQIATKDKEFTFKLNGAQKVNMDSFMAARNGKQLFSKGSIDKNGKSILTDSLGRPIIATEGIIPQAERFATKFSFNENCFSVRMWEAAMAEMAAKADNSQGNTWAFVCNTKMYNIVQRKMSNWIRDWRTEGSFVWSKGANGYVNLGATYQSYSYAGNTISFVLDRSLDLEYPKKAFGIFLDLTVDGSGQPGIMMFTFKGGQMIHNTILGVGGKDGLSSGEVSSPVAGAKDVLWGYHAVALLAPYKSVIFEEI